MLSNKNILTGKKRLPNEPDQLLINDLDSLPIHCGDDTIIINNPNYQQARCCILHITGLPRDPTTKAPIPFTAEQISFANKISTLGNKKQMIKELCLALKKRNDTERRKEIKKISTTI